MKKVILAVLAAAALTGCAPKADTTMEQVGKFRAERDLLNRAYQRCQENVDAKYHDRLFGPGNLEGAKRAASLEQSKNDKAVCKANWERKAQALWEAQSPEVFAYYSARRAEVKKLFKAVADEATR
ncbi:hypothetical protein VPZ60_004317 [Salmonella enterica]|nr:hypothetical protein [Salmonella enterica]